MGFSWCQTSWKRLNWLWRLMISRINHEKNPDRCGSFLIESLKTSSPSGKLILGFKSKVFKVFLNNTGRGGGGARPAKPPYNYIDFDPFSEEWRSKWVYLCFPMLVSYILSKNGPNWRGQCLRFFTTFSLKLLGKGLKMCWEWQMTYQN